MTWTAPMTAVSGAVLSASQFNTYVRDNLNETAPAKVTAKGYYWVPTGTNAIAARKLVSTSDNTTISIEIGTAFGWVDGGGPSVSATTGSAALVFLSAKMSNEGDDRASGVGYAVTGATSIPIVSGADGQKSMLVDGIDPAAGLGNGIRMGASFLVTGLNPGTNVFTMKYVQSASNLTWYGQREIIVLPL